MLAAILWESFMRATDKRFSFGPVFLVLMAVCVSSACAQKASCPQSKAQEADEAVDGLDSWAAVDAYRSKYGACDDGGIMEGSSEAVARLLVDHWETLPKLKDRIATSKSLQPFVMRHLNATLDTNDLHRIDHNAATRCPNGAQSLCLELRKASDDALKK